ncbi:hypothetical protein TELCIR_09319 [Teladorsagia circumcincta]|uniref:Haloacid dehalogenase-like hydrolase n=1 Tax=Teladorsagia circumcincta TaxID=45464 RepID=A0A2G9UF55_TELCI|nr:hypothetical protein TELCIR_09319 [Teladorsagia circumcincta]
MTVGNEVKLVIFDKDGTLVDFHRMWLPWAANTVQLLERATARPVGPAVYKTLGVDPVQGRNLFSSLAEYVCGCDPALFVTILQGWTLSYRLLTYVPQSVAFGHCTLSRGVPSMKSSTPCETIPSWLA